MTVDARSEARQLAEEALEWAADFRAGQFHVHCHKCGAGEPYLPPELFGLVAENENLARAVLDAEARLAAVEAEREWAERKTNEIIANGGAPSPEAFAYLAAKRETHAQQIKDLERRVIEQRKRIAEFEAERVGDSHYVGRKAAEARVEQLEQERDQLAEALEQNGVDARWIVGQWQRLKDEPVKKVALDIVARVDAALAASRRAGE